MHQWWDGAGMNLCLSWQTIQQGEHRIDTSVYPLRDSRNREREFLFSSRWEITLLSTRLEWPCLHSYLIIEWQVRSKFQDEYSRLVARSSNVSSEWRIFFRPFAIDFFGSLEYQRVCRLKQWWWSISQASIFTAPFASIEKAWVTFFTELATSYKPAL